MKFAASTVAYLALASLSFLHADASERAHQHLRTHVEEREVAHRFPSHQTQGEGDGSPHVREKNHSAGRYEDYPDPDYKDRGYEEGPDPRYEDGPDPRYEDRGYEDPDPRYEDPDPRYEDRPEPRSEVYPEPRYEDAPVAREANPDGSCPFIEAIAEFTDVEIPQVTNSDEKELLVIPMPNGIGGEDINIIDFLNDKLKDDAILPVIKPGDEVPNSSTNMVCKHIDYIDESVDVLVAGIPAGTKGLCLAFNPCEQIYAVSAGFVKVDIPLTNPLLKLGFTLNTIGISINKDFTIETHNEMWDGGSMDAVSKVDGHFALKGTLSLKFGEEDSIFEFSVNGRARIFVDVDPANDNTHLTAFEHMDDFEMVISGLIFPKIVIGKFPLVLTFNFSKVLNAAIDIHLLVDEQNTQLEFAASVNTDLMNICEVSPATKFLCKYFEQASAGLSLQVQSFVNINQEFGLRFAISGELDAPEFMDIAFKQLFPKWPADGHAFDLSIWFELNADQEIETCVDAGLGPMCFTPKCLNNDDCGGDQICHLFKCQAKLPDGTVGCFSDYDCQNFCNGGICTGKLDNGQMCNWEDIRCKSDHCVGNICRECAKHSDCPSGEACRGTPLQCRELHDNGSMCNWDDNNCASGHCVSNICRECAKHSDCPSGESCRGTPLQCRELHDNGSMCNWDDNNCASGHCVSNICRECAKHSDCPSGEACRGTPLQCRESKNIGEMCNWDDNVCASGHCVGNLCAECDGSNSHCKSWQWCDGNKCRSKGNDGYWCYGENARCHSNSCKWEKDGFWDPGHYGCQGN
ncbi:unnamed protein product [Cylindrotheca closterium]|uniref:Uncharacterized protein n=1 Tax=Cylindrotheca closterium TaxID=2856 RepID=A0AAD2FBW3_9STRA|nr:unnamed protein product [Cylindrotheca closterium]